MNNTASKPAENKMGTMPVGRLLISMSLPMMFSMLIQALYNIVDSIYVGRIGEHALTAVSLIFPMQTIVMSIAGGTCVGINAMLSRRLGEKDFKGANAVAQHGIFLCVLGGVIVSAFMMFFAPVFVGIQTTEPAIYGNAVTYMRICCGFCIGIFTQVTMERLLTSTGKTTLTMASQLSGAVINIILDPILIFGFFGLPKMGVAGAALATVIAQCCAGIIGLVLNIRFNKEISLNMKGFRPDLPLIGLVYKIGIPSIIMMSIGSVMTFGMNMIFLRYLHSSTASAVFGVYFKLNSFIFMPVFGLNGGMVPVIAYNYGARHRKRILDTLQFSRILAIVIMLVGVALFWIIPDKLLMIFSASDNMIAIGVVALRLISLTFPMAGFCMTTGSCMQALGVSFYSMIISLARQLIVLLPAAFILAVIGGIDATWWSFAIAEIVSLALTIVFYRKTKRELIDPLPE